MKLLTTKEKLRLVGGVKGLIERMKRDRKMKPDFIAEPEGEHEDDIHEEELAEVE